MASNRKSLLNPMMKQRARLADTPMRQLFEEDKNRFKTFTASAGDILLDYSKNRIDQKAMDLSFPRYEFQEPRHGVDVCRERDQTYAAPLYVTASLLVKETGEIKESQVYLGEFPMMTPDGT
ncbi:MAG: hypothetical protein J0I48_09215, partial [Devosia sp.]|nr:hypothetical protein [Devosia sp.]